MVAGKLHALLNPADHIAADVEQHADFGIASFEQSAVQLFATFFSRGKQSLEHEARARTLHKLVGAVDVSERMQDEVRELVFYRFGHRTFSLLN